MEISFDILGRYFITEKHDFLAFSACVENFPCFGGKFPAKTQDSQTT
jgi:hypothetical protein